MKSYLKVLSLVMAVVLVMSMMLTGCGQSTNDEKEVAKSEQKGVSDHSKETANQSVEGTDISKEVHLDWYYVGNKEEIDNDLVSEEMSKYTKEKINATVQMHVFDWGSFGQKVEMMIASGEKMDVLCNGSVLNHPQMIAKGSLMDMTDLYDKYGKNIQKYMSEDLIQGAKFDGKLYGVPMISILGSQYGPVIRKDIVEKAGVDLSTINTYADCTSLWEACREVEPSFSVMLGAGVDIYAMGFQPIGDGPGTLKGNKELKVVNEYEDPDFKANIELIRQWYKEGYINKESVNKQFNHTAALRDDKLHCIVGQAKVGIEPEVQAGIGNKYEFTKAVLRKPILDTYSCYFVSTCIPRTCPEPERAMMFIDLLIGDPYLQNLSNYGIEGKHYVKTEDGRLDFPEGVDPTQLTYNPNLTWEWQNAYIQHTNVSYPIDFLDQLKAYNETSEPSVALGFNFNAEPVKTEIAACENVRQEYERTILSGAVEVDEIYPKMIEKFKAAGIDKIIAEKQRQLDEWAKTK